MKKITLYATKVVLLQALHLVASKLHAKVATCDKMLRNNRSWKTCLVKSLCRGYCVIPGSRLLSCRCANVAYKNRQAVTIVCKYIWLRIGSPSDPRFHHTIADFRSRLTAEFCKSQWVPAHFFSHSNNKSQNLLWEPLFLSFIFP